MNKVKIIHSGDFHIGSSRSGISNGRAEIRNTFFKVIDLCKKEAADILLISGDLFDTPFPEREDVSEIIDAMKSIPETVIAISPGNHDCACPGSVWLKESFPENVYVFTSFTESYDFPEKNTRLFGAAFTDPFEKLSLLSFPKELSDTMTNICVLHGDFVSAQTESVYNPITSDAISASGFDYLALGHIHKRSDIKKIGKTYFAYCGCPDGRGFDEVGGHGVYAGTVGKEDCRLEFIELSSRKYLTFDVDISDCETSLGAAGKILNHIKENDSENFRKNLYRITLTGAVPPEFSPSATVIEEKLSGEVEHIKVTDKTYADPQNLKQLATDCSLRGIFVKKMLEKLENASENELQKYQKALKIGLTAFEREVPSDDN